MLTKNGSSNIFISFIIIICIDCVIVFTCFVNVDLFIIPTDNNQRHRFYVQCYRELMGPAYSVRFMCRGHCLAGVNLPVVRVCCLCVYLHRRLESGFVSGVRRDPSTHHQAPWKKERRGLCSEGGPPGDAASGAPSLSSDLDGEALGPAGDQPRQSRREGRVSTHRRSSKPRLIPELQSRRPPAPPGAAVKSLGTQIICNWKACESLLCG